MKKRIRCLLLVLMFCLVLCVGAAAAEQTGAQLSYVTDAAGLLSENENMLLEKMAESVSKKYGVGVYIVTVEDYRDFHSEGVYKATYTIYHEYTMGEGPNRDGIMLLLSMDDRDWAMFCYGSRCEYAFNSYGQQKLEKVFLDNFGENDWYGGFEDYVKECSVYLEKASAGKPVRASLFYPLLIVIGLSLLAAAAVVAVIWQKMDTVSEKATANAYVSAGLRLTEQTDQFTHKTTSSRKIERSSSGGSSSQSESGGGGDGSAAFPVRLCARAAEGRIQRPGKRRSGNAAPRDGQGSAGDPAGAGYPFAGGRNCAGMAAGQDGLSNDNVWRGASRLCRRAV